MVLWSMSFCFESILQKNRLSGTRAIVSALSGNEPKSSNPIAWVPPKCQHLSPDRIEAKAFVAKRKSMVCGHLQVAGEIWQRGTLLFHKTAGAAVYIFDCIRVLHSAVENGGFVRCQVKVAIGASFTPAKLFFKATATATSSQWRYTNAHPY